MGRFIGLDVGTSSAKGLAIDETGAVLAEAEHSYPLSIPRPGWAEQDPNDWWHSARIVLNSIEADRAEAIGLSGQMHGLVALGPDDRPLRPGILWNDGRSQRQCGQLEERLSREQLITLTGNRALAGFTAPKLLWLAENEPSVYRQIRRITLPKDYVRLQLCGEHATDVTDASGTLMFDVARRKWCSQLLDTLEIDSAWMPVALESATVSGVTPGLVSVAAGAGDQAAAALGVGVLGSTSPASTALGTSGVVFAARERHIPDRAGRLHAFCHAAPNTWHVMGVMLSAGGALRWLRDTVAPRTSFGTLENEARCWPAGVEGLLFAPIPCRRTYAALRSGCTRGVHGFVSATRSRRARPCRHGRGRLRSPRFFGSRG